MRLAQALFAPRAVALIGASGDASKNTARPQRYLRKHGYTGRIVPVNATRDEVLGERAYRSVADAPIDIDHAFIMVEEGEQALEDCGRKGVPVASIYSNGFADAGPAGAERQRRLVARAKNLGVRLLGPNSMGVVDLPGRVALTVNAVLEMDAPPAGGTSLISQSGTMLGTLLSRGAARGLGYAKLVSIGNEADLGVGELVELLVDDADTKVIALFLELASMHDLTMTSTQDIYRATLEKLLASPDCDAVLAAVGSSAQFHPEFAVQPILQAKRTAKPLAAFLTPHAERSLALLAERGIPAFRTPEACADAFAAFFAWRSPKPEFADRARIQLPADPFAAL